ncbi:HIT family protein [Beduini massiliensis]|uniref:HIT family protein n=1 Tax=Beduini massiliensis TaxID=1585974 RepID=UPI00059A83F0|nr:HIT family protein [Beduini massiliensis]
MNCLICNRIEQIKKKQNRYFVKELKTGYVVLGDSQYFKGYTLFLCKFHAVELFDLEENFRKEFMEEMIIVAKAVKIAFHAEKMNYECLGNGDAHLHWHLFPRRIQDTPIPGPVWWVPYEKMNHVRYQLDDATLKKEIKKLQKVLDELL